MANKDTGSIDNIQRIGRPRLYVETVNVMCIAFQRSHRKLTRKTSEQLGLTQSTNTRACMNAKSNFFKPDQTKMVVPSALRLQRSQQKIPKRNILRFLTRILSKN